MQLNDLFKNIFLGVIRKLMDFDEKDKQIQKKLIGLQAKLERQNLSFTDNIKNLRMHSRNKINYENKK